CCQIVAHVCVFFFFSSRRRHTRSKRDWSSDVCSSDLGSGSPRVVLVAAEQGRRLFTAGADRAEVLSAVHAASAVLLDLASTEPIDLSAVEGGEYGLRAWVMACAAIALRLSGPARSRIDETGRSRARVSPSTTDFSPQRIRDIAVEAVSAVSSIRKAEMMVCGADAAAVGSFAT